MVGVVGRKCWSRYGSGGSVGNSAGVLGVDAGVAQTAFGGSMDGPGHVVKTPVVGLVIGLLGGRLSWCRSHLLPGFVANLLAAISIVLLVLGLGIAFRLIAIALASNLLPIRDMLLQLRS